MLGNSRTVKIYLPPGYSAGGIRYPVIVFHDGLEYITLANACIVLDNMIATRQIRPVIAVFVPPVNREPEYAENKKDLFVSFITRELMPAIDLKYHTSRDPRDRATIGISNGGNIALYLGVMHPECFGKIAAFSSNVIPEITEKVSGSGTMDLQFYLDMGTYDINRLIPMVDDLARLLKGKGYSVTYYKWHEGHSWGSWKEHLGLALKQFFSY
jgi:enterochelin esterase-like enzyme